MVTPAARTIWVKIDRVRTTETGRVKQMEPSGTVVAGQPLGEKLGGAWIE